MNKLIVLDVYEIDVLLKQGMAEVLGDEAYSNNYMGIITLLIEERINLEITDFRTLHGEFETYGVGYEQANMILSRLTYPIARILNNLIDYSGSVWYELSYTPPHTVYLEPKPMPYDNGYERAALRESAVDISDDFIPERLR